MKGNSQFGLEDLFCPHWQLFKVIGLLRKSMENKDQVLFTEDVYKNYYINYLIFLTMSF